MKNNVSVQEVSMVARTNNMINEAMKKYFLPLSAEAKRRMEKCKSTISSCAANNLISRTK